MNALQHKWMWKEDDCYSINMWSCGVCKTIYPDFENGQKMAEECCKDEKV